MGFSDGWFCLCSRCWFGKRPGVYTDYIYQGPMILVLVVSSFSVFQQEVKKPVHVISLRYVVRRVAGVTSRRPWHILHVNGDKWQRFSVSPWAWLFKSLPLENIWARVLNSNMEKENELDVQSWRKYFERSLGGFQTPRRARGSALLLSWPHFQVLMFVDLFQLLRLKRPLSCFQLNFKLQLKGTLKSPEPDTIGQRNLSQPVMFSSSVNSCQRCYRSFWFGFSTNFWLFLVFFTPTLFCMSCKNSILSQFWPQDTFAPLQNLKNSLNYV